ncbi:FMN-binding negative transcriptional regulator [Diaminobutyricimonas sp. LJ205]|uniref:FMN-binding negative transcriptional regulator n=1 Tax=Diaminobutyricimonas sp. LJ205 TaxID=2683590 RepID=UPI0012F4CF21|nr:FMN-binding negative transcriptional regulator [Diaminobutyricimonas sp. LJ205]
MRQNPSFTLAGEDGIKRLIRENPFATIVSNTDAGGLVASHYPVILDEEAEGIVLLSHVGKPDDLIHELGSHELLVIVQGSHGYISPGWYGDGPAVPTWNFSAAHLTGTPEILSAEENLKVLDRLVEHFEHVMPHPRLMNGTPENAAYAEKISAGTVGFRLRVQRFVAKDKMSQNKPADTVVEIIHGLESDEHYANPALVNQMRRVHPNAASKRPSR